MAYADKQALRDRAGAVLNSHGAHYLIDTVADLMPVIENIEARMSEGEGPPNKIAEGGTSHRFIREPASRLVTLVLQMSARGVGIFLAAQATWKAAQGMSSPGLARWRLISGHIAVQTRIPNPLPQR